MTLEWVHPGLLLILGAWVLPFLKGRVKRAAMLILPIAALVLCLRMSQGNYCAGSFLWQDLVFGRVDSARVVFSYVFSVLSLLAPAQVSK